jgi:hypothetical protein
MGLCRKSIALEGEIWAPYLSVLVDEKAHSVDDRCPQWG